MHEMKTGLFCQPLPLMRLLSFSGRLLELLEILIMKQYEWFKDNKATSIPTIQLQKLNIKN